MSHASVCGQLTITANIMIVYFVVEWEGSSDKTQIVIDIPHSELQFPCL
jgi:hypothetical protein